MNEPSQQQALMVWGKSRIVFEYEGGFLVRPCSRGTCLTDRDDWLGLDEVLPEGNYTAKIVIYRHDE